jgi:hypothetical protein
VFSRNNRESFEDSDYVSRYGVLYVDCAEGRGPEICIMAPRRKQSRFVRISYQPRDERVFEKSEGRMMGRYPWTLCERDSRIA